MAFSSIPEKLKNRTFAFSHAERISQKLDRRLFPNKSFPTPFLLSEAWYLSLLLGLSKGNARVEIPASLFFSFGRKSSQVLIPQAQSFGSDACVTFD